MDQFRKNWGFILFCFVSLFALLRVLQHPPGGHFLIFTEAARSIWELKNPHGTDFGTNVGYWFYSPSCALFFFGPLSLLPYSFSLFLYLVGSWVVFVTGKNHLLKSLLGTSKNPLLESPRLNWYWAAISPQMLVAIDSVKIEIVMLGVIFFCTSWLVQNRNLLWAAFLFGMIANWKLQPLPTIGLLLLGWIWIRRESTLALTMLASLAFWTLLPFAFLPDQFGREVYFAWQETLSSFIERDFLKFQNIFAFLSHTLKAPVSYSFVKTMTLIDAIALAVLLVIWIQSWKKRRVSEKNLVKSSFLIALGWGSFFTVTYSPLNQNNAYLLYVPLFLAGFFAYFDADRLKNSKWKPFWKNTLIGVFLIMSLLYSDLVPTSFELRKLALKPLAPLFIAIALFAYTLDRPLRFSKK